jgi:hypothetical protein
MKKLLLVLVAIVLVASIASAQDVWGQGKMSAGIGAALALPMGTFGDQAGFGIGGSGTFQYGLSPEMMLTAQIGYISYGKKDLAGFGSYSISQMPILAGIKYNLGGAYLTGQVGIVSTSIEATISYYGYSATGTISSSDLAFAPGVGMSFGPIDVAAKYLIVSASGGSMSAVALDVQYVFGF